MQIPLKITFRHLPHSHAIEATIRELTNRLAKLHDRITGCHVTVSASLSARASAKVYSVRVEITIPGGAVNASSAPAEHSEHKHSEHSDLHVALSAAFETANHRLSAFAEAH